MSISSTYQSLPNASPTYRIITLDCSCGLLRRLRFNFHILLLALEDLYLLSFLPYSVHLLAIVLPVDALSVLLSIIELPLVHAAVGPLVSPFAIELVIQPGTFVRALVSPDELALAVFHSILEHSGKLAAVRPNLHAWPMPLLALQVSSILDAVLEY